jgi:GH24 family phage-related lysozyme (muramidase)
MATTVDNSLASTVPAVKAPGNSANGTNTINTMAAMLPRQGGGLIIKNVGGVNSFRNWVSAAKIPSDYKPFTISIFDTELKQDVVSLTLMINPKDLNVNQAQVINSANTRSGWINTLWGNQQAALSANGSTAGFYYVKNNKGVGISNFYRKNSIAFLNFLSIVAMFKNNAYYFMDGQETPTYYKDSTSKVINVMDTIKISYDGSEYLGSFSSFSITDSASSPYKMDYSFEFTESIFGSDPNTVEGHVKKNGNNKSNKIVNAIQGKNINFDTSVYMDLAEMQRYFPIQEDSNTVSPTNQAGPQYQVVQLSGDVTKDTMAQLKIDEGYRNDTYYDSQGYLTVGIGHLVKPGDNLKFGDVLTDAQVTEIFNKDYADHAEAAQRVVPGLADMPENIQCAIINMTFNLGEKGLSKFPAFISLIENGDYEAAANSLTTTLWHTQVGNRALRIEESIRNTGKKNIANPGG